MDDYRFVQAAVDELVRESPGLDEVDIQTMRGHIRAGEAELAFDTLCVLIDDREIRIRSEFYEHIRAAADLMEWQDMKIVDSLRRLVTD